MRSPEELQASLAQFTGSVRWYQFGETNWLLTDGVKWLADNTECWWLITHILCMQALPAVEGQSFQVWKLTVEADRSATIVGEDGNYNELHRMTIKFTDFPLPEITIWIEGVTLLLPSEH